jgi:hypothetical protein
MVTGMPESNVEGSTEDRPQFSQQCEENLSMKSAALGKDLIRLGKKTTDKPRRLPFKLRSQAANLLRSAPKLRKSINQYIATNVNFNPDLSHTAAQLTFEARKRWREAKQHHDDRLTDGG